MIERAFGAAVLFVCWFLAWQETAGDISVDFENRGEGTYTEALMVRDFNGLSWNNGLDQGRASIVSDGERGRVLRVLYPKGKVGAGNSEGGVQFKCRLGTTTDAAYAEYRVKFQSGFDFVKGGKLPGLCGGQCNTGGDKCTGTDGWSARYMWRRDGQAVVYLYDMNMQDYGTDIALNHPDNFYFQPGRWYTVKQYIRMNDPDIRNGKIQVWVDGVLLLDYKYAKFRSSESLGINLFYFSTFFGGSSSDWAPTRDEYIYFDDVRAWDATGSSVRSSATRSSDGGAPFSLRNRRLVIHRTDGATRAMLYDYRGAAVCGAAGGATIPRTGHLTAGPYLLRIATRDGVQRCFPVVLDAAPRR